MTDTGEERVADFDYELPKAAIAQHPLDRGQARLLVLDAAGEERHRRVADLPELLRPGDLLVVNDTEVIPARLFAELEGPSPRRIEVLLVEQLDQRSWTAMLRPGRRLKPGRRLRFSGQAAAEIGTRQDQLFVLDFDRPIDEALDRLGHVPLPPYIERTDTAADRDLYQTVFARHRGAIAAPTAGLHFDQALLDRLEERGIDRATVTLHVGPGTFRPMRGDRIAQHSMHDERYVVADETAAAIRRHRRSGGRIVAVGTTVVRTLESSTDAGGEVQPGTGRTKLFIRPGHRFRAIDLLLTNFHLPRSTLLVLVSALAGRERILAAYREAIASGYRFYSYGDAMLIQRRELG